MHPDSGYRNGHERQLSQISERLGNIRSKIVEIDRRPLPQREGNGSNIGRFHAANRIDLAKCEGKLGEVADQLVELPIYPGSATESGRYIYGRYEAQWVVLIKMMSHIDCDSTGELRKQFLQSGNRSYAAWLLVTWANFWSHVRNV